jgi:hypothetical protein
MKKLLFVFAFVAVYGISMAIPANNVVIPADETVAIVAEDLNNNVSEDEKDKKATTAKTDAKAEGCSGEKSAKSEGCSGEKHAKSKGCSGEKTAEAKKESSSGAGGK